VAQAFPRMNFGFYLSLTKQTGAPLFAFFAKGGNQENRVIGSSRDRVI